jgi:large subunit ribosomal protein L4
MLSVSVYTSKGDKAGEQSLNPKVFGVKITPELVHQVVVAEQANSRQVLGHTKTKAEVRGGGKKPWKQKGTGRARHGSIRGPQWRGGGVVFGPRATRNYTQKINKKMKRAAVLMTLTDKVVNNKLIVLDHLDVSGKAKSWHDNTKQVWKEVAKSKAAQPSVLVLVPAIGDSLKRATKNVKRVEAIRTDSLNVNALLKHEYTLTTVAGLNSLEKWFLKN